jgi:hypothetical protein
VVGFGLIIGIEFLLILIANEVFSARIFPRGLGWFTLPVFGAVAGWKVGYSGGLLDFVSAIPLSINSLGRRCKVTLSLSVVWIVAMLGFFYVFNPFGRFWDKDDCLKFSALIAGIPLLAFLTTALLSWATKEGKER